MLKLELRNQVSIWGKQCYSVSAAQIVAHVGSTVPQTTFPLVTPHPGFPALCYPLIWLVTAGFAPKQELSNPYVNPYLDFYPEETHGLHVNKFSQSNKWLKCLGPDLRAPMVSVGNKHFYIFEPTRLASGHIVVPIFFYQEGGNLWAKCVLRPTFVITSNPKRCTITIPTDLSFDSEVLTPIKVSDFALVYSEIQMSNGVFLSQLCSNELCGKSPAGFCLVIGPQPNH
jgi:hypothetical protein